MGFFGLSSMLVDVFKKGSRSLKQTKISKYRQQLLLCSGKKVSWRAVGCMVGSVEIHPRKLC